MHGSDRRVRLALGYCMIGFRSTFSIELITPGSSSPGIIVANTHSVGASLVVWLLSRLLAWTDAGSFTELRYVILTQVTFTHCIQSTPFGRVLDLRPQTKVSTSYEEPDGNVYA